MTTAGFSARQGGPRCPGRLATRQAGTEFMAGPREGRVRLVAPVGPGKFPLLLSFERRGEREKRSQGSHSIRLVFVHMLNLHRKSSSMRLSKKFAITQEVSSRSHWALIDIRLQAVMEMFIKFVIKPSCSCISLSSLHGHNRGNGTLLNLKSV